MLAFVGRKYGKFLPTCVMSQPATGPTIEWREIYCRGCRDALYIALMNRDAAAQLLFRQKLCSYGVEKSPSVRRKAPTFPLTFI